VDTHAVSGWIRIRDIPGSDLAAGRKIALVAMALEELGVAQALVMMHGRDRGAEVYAAHGSCVRFDDDGEPVVPR
jgi:hypothetical protein